MRRTGEIVRKLEEEKEDEEEEGSRVILTIRFAGLWKRRSALHCHGPSFPGATHPFSFWRCLGGCGFTLTLDCRPFTSSPQVCVCVCVCVCKREKKQIGAAHFEMGDAKSGKDVDEQALHFSLIPAPAQPPLNKCQAVGEAEECCGKKIRKRSIFCDEPSPVSCYTPFSGFVVCWRGHLNWESWARWTLSRCDRDFPAQCSRAATLASWSAPGSRGEARDPNSPRNVTVIYWVGQKVRLVFFHKMALAVFRGL